jgi:hypothetical protein
MVSSVNGVRAMDDVAADIDAEVSTDSAGKGVCGLSGTEHDATSGYRVKSLPDHGTNRS